MLLPVEWLRSLTNIEWSSRKSVVVPLTVLCRLSPSAPYTKLLVLAPLTHCTNSFWLSHVFVRPPPVRVLPFQSQPPRRRDSSQRLICGGDSLT